MGDWVLAGNQFIVSQACTITISVTQAITMKRCLKINCRIQLHHTTKIQPQLYVWKPSGLRAPEFLVIKKNYTQPTVTKPLITSSSRANTSPSCSSWVGWAMEEENPVHCSCRVTLMYQERRGLWRLTTLCARTEAPDVQHSENSVTQEIYTKHTPWLRNFPLHSLIHLHVGQQTLGRPLANSGSTHDRL